MNCPGPSTYPGEGWGLCAQPGEQRLVLSDGTARLTFRRPAGGRTACGTGLASTRRSAAWRWPPSPTATHPSLELSGPGRNGAAEGTWVSVAARVRRGGRGRCRSWRLFRASCAGGTG
ncbi:glutaminyl-peptide cyclotransferase [Streptomyces sp. NPDC003691]